MRVATRTIGASPISSANCQPAVKNSGGDGPNTMYACTIRARKKFHHPVVGDIEVGYETMPLPADPGLVLTIYTAEPGSPSEERPELLASWAATNAQQARDPSEHHNV